MLSRISENDENSPRKSDEGASPSPITGIVRGLMKSTLSSENCLKRHINETEDNRHIREDSVGTRCLSEHGHTGSTGTKQGLFRDVFKFKKTPENLVKSRPRSRRLHGMASQRLLSPVPVSPSVGKENSNTGGCSPRAASPQKTPVASKKCRYPLGDCDPNSQDSGYGANHPGKVEKLEKLEKPREGFRFLEPMAVAPRRISIECRSPVQSPIRLSPLQVRTVRQSLFRNHSSGYESMDDDFNDLIDVEPLEDSQATQQPLPNDISTLLRGDIVRSPEPLCDISSTIKMDTNSPNTTPVLRRANSSGNFRRSLFLQNEKLEIRKNSSLSKVRSCLFGSPNSSSPNSSPPFQVSNSNFKNSELMDQLTNTTATTATTTTTVQPSLYRRRIGYTDELSKNNGIVSSVSGKTFKRPEPPMDESPKLVKRLRRSNSTFFNGLLHCCSIDTLTLSSPLAEISCQRSLSETSATIAVTEATMGAIKTETDNHSAANSESDSDSDIDIEVEFETESHALIESAIRRSIADTDLTGDFSKPCVLPLTVGRHQDLKSISAGTLAALVRGEFNDRVRSFKIVDCRYPYEYFGGHVQGAVNLYNKELVEEYFLFPVIDIPEIQPDTDKRDILVFHCEFSWKRAPYLYRFLRSYDRHVNKEHYPALRYPEIYLLHAGYHRFYAEQKELCTPQDYRPMKHPDHQSDFRLFRSKSKSWQGGKSRITDHATRTSLKRLGF